MNFWGNLIEHFKSRSAWIFVPALMAFFAAILIPQFLLSEFSNVDFSGADFEMVIRILFCAMPVVVLLLVAWIGAMIRRRRARRRKLYEISPLSRDEMNKAMSKLGKTKT